MEFFVDDPGVKRSPPDQTRLLDLRAEPYPDGRRLRVTLELTPFQQKPNLELTLADADGDESAAASIVEPVAWKLELTLHIRKPSPVTGKYTLLACLSYPELGEVDRRKITLDVPAPIE